MTPDMLAEKFANIQARASAAHARLEAMPLARALRLHRPASLLLLTWPVLWGFFSTAGGVLVNFPLAVALALVMRAASCIYDDLTDRDIERLGPGPRKKTEQAPSALLLIVLLAVGLAIAWALSPLVLFLTLLWLLMVAVYPHLYKITWWPQLYAGFIFGAWPVLMGQAASGGLMFSAVVLMAGGFFWVAAVETLRADAKREVDLARDLKSIALILGGRRVSFIGGCLVAAFVMLVLMGMVTQSGGLYYGALMIAQALISAAFYMPKGKGKQAQTAHNAYRMSSLAGLMITIAFVLN